MTDTHEATCSSCGRFVGPYPTCPYCGAHLKGRLSLRAVKIIAVLLATLGLAALWWAARRVPIPPVTAAEAQGSMNMAYVQVEGRITGNMTYDPEGDYLGFWVTDRTGDMRISCYRDVTRALMASGSVPALGDEVVIAGTLRIREDFVSLTVNAAEHVTVRRVAPVPMVINALTPLDEGRRVTVGGEVRRIFSPYAGLTLITVRDATGDIVISVDEVSTQLGGPLPPLVEGQFVTAEGVVTLYRDAPQVALTAGRDLRLGELAVVAEPTSIPTPAFTPTPMPTPAPGETPLPTPTETATPTSTPTAAATSTPTPVPTRPIRSLGSLTAADVDSWVRVRGRVVTWEGFSAGLKGMLDDGTGQVLLLTWTNVYRDLRPPTALDLGAEVVLNGKVGIYEGQLQVVPGEVSDITIVTAAPLPPLVQANQITIADAGRVIRLRGVLEAPQPFSAGYKVVLNDESGGATLLLWSNVYEALSPRPEAGVAVEVVGQVSVYRNTIEIAPRSSFDWRGQ